MRVSGIVSQLAHSLSHLPESGRPGKHFSTIRPAPVSNDNNSG